MGQSTKKTEKSKISVFRQRANLVVRAEWTIVWTALLILFLVWGAIGYTFDIIVASSFKDWIKLKYDVRNSATEGPQHIDSDSLFAAEYIFGISGAVVILYLIFVTWIGYNWNSKPKNTSESGWISILRDFVFVIGFGSAVLVTISVSVGLGLLYVNFTELVLTIKEFLLTVSPASEAADAQLAAETALWYLGIFGTTIIKMICLVGLVAYLTGGIQQNSVRRCNVWSTIQVMALVASAVVLFYPMTIYKPVFLIVCIMMYRLFIVYTVQKFKQEIQHKY